MQRLADLQGACLKNAILKQNKKDDPYLRLFCFIVKIINELTNINKYANLLLNQFVYLIFLKNPPKKNKLATQ